MVQILVAIIVCNCQVRDKYLEGSGINSSIAVNQDIDGKAYDQVVSWALGTGSPYIFNTTMEKQTKVDEEIRGLEKDVRLAKITEESAKQALKEFISIIPPIGGG